MTNPAIELARQMVTRFGMSPRLGHPTYGQPLNGRFLSPAFLSEERNYSEETAGVIDAEVRRIVDESYERVKDVLTDRREELQRIAAKLIRTETLDCDALERLLKPVA